MVQWLNPLGLDSFLQLFFLFFGEKGVCNFPNEMGPSFLRKRVPKIWLFKEKGFKFLEKTWYSKNLACFLKELEPICLREPRKPGLLGNLGPLALGELQVHLLVGKLGETWLSPLPLLEVCKSLSLRGNLFEQLVSEVYLSFIHLWKKLKSWKKLSLGPLG